MNFTVPSFVLVIAGLVSLWIMDGINAGQSIRAFEEVHVFRIAFLINLLCLMFMFLIVYKSARDAEDYERFIEHRWEDEEW